jgi:hypothetical protein
MPSATATGCSTRLIESGDYDPVVHSASQADRARSSTTRPGPGSTRCRFVPIAGATSRALGLDLADEPRTDDQKA